MLRGWVDAGQPGSVVQKAVILCSVVVQFRRWRLEEVAVWVIHVPSFRARPDDGRRLSRGMMASYKELNVYNVLKWLELLLMLVAFFLNKCPLILKFNNKVCFSELTPISFSLKWVKQNQRNMLWSRRNEGHFHRSVCANTAANFNWQNVLSVVKPEDPGKHNQGTWKTRHIKYSPRLASPSFASSQVTSHIPIRILQTKEVTESHFWLHQDVRSFPV